MTTEKNGLGTESTKAADDSEGKAPDVKFAEDENPTVKDAAEDIADCFGVGESDGE